MTTDQHDLHPARRRLLWLARFVGYVINVYVVVVEVILITGFFFLLLGADPTSSFVDWIYRTLDSAMDPFRGMFTPIELGTTSGNDVQSVLETSILFAMVAYMIVALAVSTFIHWMSEWIDKLDRENADYQRRVALHEAGLVVDPATGMIVAMPAAPNPAVVQPATPPATAPPATSQPAATVPVAPDPAVSPPATPPAAPPSSV